MATDYDARARPTTSLSEDSSRILKARRVDKSPASVDGRDRGGRGLEPPGADLSGEELGACPAQAGRRVHVLLVLSRTTAALRTENGSLCAPVA